MASTVYVDKLSEEFWISDYVCVGTVVWYNYTNLIVSLYDMQRWLIFPSDMENNSSLDFFMYILSYGD